MAVALKDLLVVLCEPTTTAAERIRSLRTNVARLVPKDAPIIAVCSTWPGEGKSSVSANLAAAFAQVRSGAILLDADLRRPSLTLMAGLADRKGLADCLRSQGSNVTSYLVETDTPGLSILPAGRAEESSVDLLSGLPLEEALRSLQAGGKPVVVDTPPLSIGSDALLIGTHCDGVILVVHSKRWEGKGELDAKIALEDHGIRILGVLLNEVRDSAPGDYRHYKPYSTKKS